MAVIDGIGLAEPSTITKSLAAVPITRNSSVTYQEAMVLASPNSTTLLALAEVMGSAPPSTTVGLVTRPIGPLVVAQSTAGDLNVTVAGYSTTVNVSSLGGAVIVRSSAANALVTVYQSTATDLLARVNQGVGNSSAADRWRMNAANSSAADYVPVRLVDSSGTGFLTPGNEYTNASTYSSFAGPTLTYDNSSNNTYRAVGISQPLPVQLRPGITTYNSTTNLITSTHTTAVYSIVSSAAVRQKVYAYSITSTHTVPSTMLFLSSLGQTIWAVQFGSGSSGVSGANLAVSPPAYLFATEVNAALNVVIENGSSAASTVIARLSISYVSEV